MRTNLESKRISTLIKQNRKKIGCVPAHSNAIKMHLQLQQVSFSTKSQPDLFY